MGLEEGPLYKHKIACVSTECVLCVWLLAGLQPHLVWVTLIRLWAGWGCTPVVQSNHGTQDKPAITTHTQERDTVMAACYICSVNTILSSPINEFSNKIYPCRRAQAKATKVVCGRVVCYTGTQCVWRFSDQEGKWEGCPNPLWSHQPLSRTATSAPALLNDSVGQRRSGEAAQQLPWATICS